MFAPAHSPAPQPIQYQRPPALQQNEVQMTTLEPVYTPVPASGLDGELPAAAGGGKKMQREAKTYFANERTLLAWINSVTFLALTGVTLILDSALLTSAEFGRILGFLVIVLGKC